MSGEDGVLNLGDDGVLKAYDAGEDGLAGFEFGDEVPAQLFFHAHGGVFAALELGQCLGLADFRHRLLLAASVA